MSSGAAEGSGAEDALSFYALLNVSREASEEDIKRSFRTLAQTYHPDKQQDEQRKVDASASFMRLQEAYEVLVDPERRAVYDIYGKEGLDSGLEVGTHLATRDELRAAWAQFQAQRAAGGTGRSEMQRDDRFDYRGVYLIKVDASPMFDFYDRDVAHAPDVISTASSPTVSVALSPADHLSVGVQTVTKRGVGGSSFVAGYKRIVTPQDSLDVHVMAGLKTLVSVASTRQLGQHSTATLASTWQPDMGLGLQLSTARQLSQKWHGEATWVVGPQPAQGLGVSLTRRDDKSLLSLKLDVGMGAGFSARYVRSLTERATGRISGRFGITGVDLEIGASRRFAHSTSAGMYVSVGLTGIVAKVTAARRGQQLQVPVILSHRPDDWRVLVGAHVLPPLVGTALRYGVIGPLLRRHRLRQALARRREGLSEVRQLIAEAQRAQDLMRPVAARKTAASAAEGGIIVVEALYGRLEAMPPPCAEPADASAASAAASPPPADEPASPDAHSPRPRHFAAGDSDAEDAGSDSGSEAGGRTDRAANAAAQTALAAAGELPPQWLDVTVAVRFLVGGGRLQLHAGVRKAGLMGFCDVAPGELKHLRVVFLESHDAANPSVATFADTQAGALPGEGQPADDAAQRDAILAAAREGGWLDGVSTAASQA